MYRCQKCNAVVPANTSRMLIVKTRPKIYPHRRGIYKKVVFEKGKKVIKWLDDPGGVGTEIDSELQVCVKCMTAHQEKLKQQQQAQNIKMGVA
jgi:hypothetical protein